MSPDQKKRGGAATHLAFGGLWGVAYGFARESVPGLIRPFAVAGYATAVWLLSDNLLLPAFGLSGWPRRYPAKNHLYAWLAHLSYGGAAAAAYYYLRGLAVAPVVSAVWLALLRRRLRRRLPRRLYSGVAPAMGALSPLVRSAVHLRSRAFRL